MNNGPRDVHFLTRTLDETGDWGYGVPGHLVFTETVDPQANTGHRVSYEQTGDPVFDFPDAGWAYNYYVSLSLRYDEPGSSISNDTYVCTYDPTVSHGTSYSGPGGIGLGGHLEDQRIEASLTDPFTSGQWQQTVESGAVFRGTLEDRQAGYGVFAKRVFDPVKGANGASAFVCSLHRVQFQWRCNSDPGQVVRTDEVFTPYDDQLQRVDDTRAEHNVQQWATAGATQSPVYVLDPLQRRGGQHGRYDIVPLNENVASKDRFVGGSFDTARMTSGVARVQFVNVTTGEDLGTYTLGNGPDTFVYDSEEDAFSGAELDGVLNGQLSDSSRKLTQNVVLYRDKDQPSVLHFATVFSKLGTVELRYFDYNNRPVGKVSRTLTADADYADLFDFLGKRVASLDVGALPNFAILGDAEGDGSEDDQFWDDFPGGGVPLSAQPAGTAVRKRHLRLPLTWRLSIPPGPQTRSSGGGGPPAPPASHVHNFLAKVVDSAWSNGVGVGVLCPIGLTKGFVDGVYDGVASDLTGIKDLAVFASEGIRGDFHPAKAIYDGLKLLSKLDAAGWKALAQGMTRLRPGLRGGLRHRAGRRHLRRRGAGEQGRRGHEGRPRGHPGGRVRGQRRHQGAEVCRADGALPQPVR